MGFIYSGIQFPHMPTLQQQQNQQKTQQTTIQMKPPIQNKHTEPRDLPVPSQIVVQFVSSKKANGEGKE